MGVLPSDNGLPIAKKKLDGLTNKLLNVKLTLDKESNLKTLGLSWCTRTDEIHYSVNPIKIDSTHISKRIILSEIAKNPDPLGLFSPL